MLYLIAEDPEWDKILSKFPQSDIYFTAAYHKSFESSMGRQARAFAYEADGETFFYPFMIGSIDKIGDRKIQNRCFDIETVYGYSGPLSTTQQPEFLEKAYKAFYSFCAGLNIVCEMIRFHPLLHTQLYAGPKTEVLFNRKTISISSKNKKNYNATLRNELRRAQKLGLRFITEEIPLDKFIQAYDLTMKRLDAAPFYIFKNEHYNFIHDHARVFGVYEGAELLAVAAIMGCAPFLHYHLCGCAEKKRNSIATKFLVHKTSEWAIERGFEIFHLGGGRTSSPEDSLLAFKSRLGSVTNDFYIGKTILNKKLYDNICAEWRQLGGEAPPSFLQCYRMPIKKALAA